MLGLAARLRGGERLLDQPLGGVELAAARRARRRAAPWRTRGARPARRAGPRRGSRAAASRPRGRRPSRTGRARGSTSRWAPPASRPAAARPPRAPRRTASPTSHWPSLSIARWRATPAISSRALVLVRGVARRLLGALQPRLDLVDRPAHRARHAAARERQLRVLGDRVRRQPVDPADRLVRLAVAVEREPVAPQRLGGDVHVAGADRVLDRPVHVAAVGEPGARPAVQVGDALGREALELAQQHGAEHACGSGTSAARRRAGRRTGCCARARAASRRCRGARARRRTARSTAARAPRCASGSSRVSGVCWATTSSHR